MILTKLKNWWQSRRYYVMADPNDNSITLSKALFRHLQDSAHEGETARVFVFRLTYNNTYAFMVNPPIEQPTQMCDIQHNVQYNCIGFETLCPSVGKIFYDYGIPAYKPQRLAVTIHKSVDKYYYQFERPCKVS
jgi:hypothetical protein